MILTYDDRANHFFDEMVTVEVAEKEAYMACQAVIKHGPNKGTNKTTLSGYLHINKPAIRLEVQLFDSHAQVQCNTVHSINFSQFLSILLQCRC